jgi:L-lactate dehydrogenase complex protein LldG
MSAREEVLARVRSALGTTGSAQGHGGDRGDARAGTAREYRTRGEHPPGHAVLLDLLVDRLEDYRAGVRRTTPDGLAQAVAEALADGLARADREPPRADPERPTRARVVVPPGLPREWVAAADVEAVIDDGLDTDALDALDGVVTAAAVAIAETGTIVLDASPEQGRRAITLVPDLHVCVVRAEQVVACVPEGIARLQPTRPLTWISGPSATSDIELNRVEGVHGPRTLEVVIVEESTGPR